jgi:ubiquinone/menaquinone biosynthesis C-methylase UbiE
MLERDFSHVPNFTDYMVLVEGLVLAGQPHQRILDIPAGQGLLAARLREHGHEVVCGDINRAQPDYVYADLNERLPFPDGDFDTCLCTEGVEHVIDSAALIQELCRVTRCGGRLIVS